MDVPPKLLVRPGKSCAPPQSHRVAIAARPTTQQRVVAPLLPARTAVATSSTLRRKKSLAQNSACVCVCNFNYCEEPAAVTIVVTEEEKSASSSSRRWLLLRRDQASAILGVRVQDVAVGREGDSGVPKPPSHQRVDPAPLS